MSIQSWCIRKLTAGGSYSATGFGTHGLHVKRPGLDDVVAYCPDSSDVPFTESDLEAAFAEVPEAQALVLVNRPLDAGVFEVAVAEGLLVASFGHFERALGHADVTGFVHPEEVYLRRRLTQRSQVAGVSRIGMRAWRVDRTGRLRPLTIITHDRYEFTDDEMWQLIGAHPGVEPDAFVVTNPNTRGFGNRVATSAAGLGVVICTTNEFVARLGKTWN